MVSLVPSGYVKTFNRYEAKYLVPRRDASSFVDAIRPFVTLDPHSHDERGYVVHSVYWDSPDRVLFWEKVEGLKDRRKLRVRHYGDSPELYLEIKQRTDRTIQKRRTRTGTAAFRDRASLRTLDLETRREAVVSEALCLIHGYDLWPTIAVSYRRRAWMATYEPGVRITVDTNLRYRVRDLDQGGRRASDPFFLDPRLAIVEIKYNDRIPSWLCALAARESLLFVRFSKYCTAMDAEYYENQLT